MRAKTGCKSSGQSRLTIRQRARRGPRIIESGIIALSSLLFFFFFIFYLSSSRIRASFTLRSRYADLLTPSPPPLPSPRPVAKFIAIGSFVLSRIEQISLAPSSFSFSSSLVADGSADFAARALHSNRVEFLAPRRWPIFAALVHSPSFSGASSTIVATPLLRGFIGIDRGRDDEL